MALNFPVTPAPGEIFTAEGATFIWNGTVWMAQAPAVMPWATPEEARAMTRGDVVMSPLTTKAASRLKAWLAFDGTGNANIAGENLSGARTATGEFTFTFGTPMPDTKYAVVVGIGTAGGGFGAHAFSLKAVDTFRLIINRVDVATVRANPTTIDLAVFG